MGGTGCLMDNVPLPDFTFTTADDRYCVHLNNKDGVAMLVDASAGLDVHRIHITPTASAASLPPRMLALLADAQQVMVKCVMRARQQEEPEC